MSGKHASWILAGLLALGAAWAIVLGVRMEREEPPRMRFLNYYGPNGARVPGVVYDTEAKTVALEDGGAYSVEQIEAAEHAAHMRELDNQIDAGNHLLKFFYDAAGAPPEVDSKEVAEILRKKLERYDRAKAAAEKK